MYKYNQHVSCFPSHFAPYRGTTVQHVLRFLAAEIYRITPYKYKH